MNNSADPPSDPLRTRHSMLVRMGDGDDDAWHWFTARYDGFVRDVLRRSIWPESRLAEATADFWSFAFEQRLVKKHEPTRRFRAFLSGCLTNFSRKWVHKNRSTTPQAGDPAPEIPDPGADTTHKEQREVAAWTEHLLGVALRSLDTEQRSRHHAEVLRMFYGLDTADAASTPLTGSQIASRLGIEPNAVHVRLHRARIALRQQVEFEVQQTVGDPASLQDELAAILGAIGARRPGLVDRR